MVKATVYFKNGNTVSVDNLTTIKQQTNNKSFTVDQWESVGLKEERYIFIGDRESVYFHGADVAYIKIEK